MNDKTELEIAIFLLVGDKLLANEINYIADVARRVKANEITMDQAFEMMKTGDNDQLDRAIAAAREQA